MFENRACHPARNVIVAAVMLLLAVVAVSMPVRADVRTYIATIQCKGEGSAFASWDWTQGGIIIPGAGGGVGCIETGSATTSPRARPTSADGISASLSACVMTGNIRPIFKCDRTSASDTLDPAKSYTLSLHVNVAISGGLGESANFKLNEISRAPPTTPSAPQALWAIPGDDTVTLGWLYPSSDGGSVVTDYRVYRGTSPGGETFLANAGTKSAYQDTTATDGATYYYQVTAVTQLGESPKSNEANATPNSPAPISMYEVMFVESGLPVGTSWYATLGGTTQTSTTNLISFSESNGTYAYTVGAIPGYSTSNYAGEITVSGNTASQTIVFSIAPSLPRISSFQASSSPIALGSSVTFTVTATGGTGALTYVYTGLPSGCASANVAALTCTPSAAGSFTITVTATDSEGEDVSATVALTVNPKEGSGGSPSGNTILGLPALEGYGILAAIAIAIAAGGTVAVARSRRRRSIRQRSPPPSPPR